MRKGWEGSPRAGAGAGGSTVPRRSSPLARASATATTPHGMPSFSPRGAEERESTSAGLLGHLQPGIQVWVPNPYNEDDTESYYRMSWLPSKACGRPLWVPGSIVGVHGTAPRRVSDMSSSELSKVSVEVTTELDPPITLTLPANEVLPVNQVSPMQVHDLVDLAHLTEPAVLFGVVTRFLGDAVYTKAGHMLLAVNPYRIILDRSGDSIYDPVYIQRYRNRMSPAVLDTLPAAKRNQHSLPPHVFETADQAYTSMMNELSPQSIVISGESGAGKTETTKMLLSYLANVSTEAATANSPPSLKRRPSRPLIPTGHKRRGSIGAHSNPFSSDHLSRVERQLLETNPVLEAFGNAKTIRNDNSSRFGKLLRVVFDRSGRIAGWTTTSYLLEKSRVTSQAFGERSFHVFYFLLAGADPSLRGDLKLLPALDYKYLNPVVRDSRGRVSHPPRSALATIPGVEDSDEFANLAEKLSLLGFSSSTQRSIWKVVSSVLSLGNVEFEGEETVRVKNRALVNDIASLLGVDSEKLATALVTTTITDKREDTVTVKPLTMDSCVRGRDALSKTLYGRLFVFLVVEINRLVAEAAGAESRAVCQAPDALFVGLLDIFGFEVFEVNSFEQLCINYANEKLQQFFTEHVFKVEMETYRREAIDFGDLTFKDNTGIIDLIENKKTGLMVMLQEACLFPRANDKTFVNKLNSTHGRRNEHFARPDKRTEQTHFTIIHSAAPVTYTAEGFVQKNQDRLSTTLDAAIQSSSDPVVAALFTDAYSEVAGQNSGAGVVPSSASAGGSAASSSFNAASSFLCTKFRDDMARLNNTLRATQPHFIRCIKPNNLKQANYIDPALVHHQLMYLGVLDAIRVRHSGFSYRTVYSDFFDRFIIGAQQGGRLVYPPPPDVDIKDLCRELLDQLKEHHIFDGMNIAANVQFGRTKIFLRKRMIRNLEALREVRLAAMDRMAIKAQAIWRGYMVRRDLRLMHEGFLRVQAAWRGRIHRSLWFARTWSARVIQYTIRGWLKRRWYRRYITAVVSVQAWVRRCARRRVWVRLRRGIRVFHSLARGYIVRVHVVQMLTAANRLQTAARSFLARNRLYWQKVRAVLLFQAVWRGYKHRFDNEDMMHFLALRRMDRARGRAARRFQATWRALLVWRRFKQIRNAALTLQRWMLLKLNRQRFLAQQWAVRKIQAVARGYEGREQVRRVRTLYSIADELWRLQKVREREFLELAHMNSDRRAMERANSRFFSTSKRTAQVQFKLLDVDVILDNSDVFPRGWTQLFAEIEAELWSQGTRPLSVALGAAHSVLLTEEGRVYTWGWGDRGQCGHGTWTGERRPRLVEALLQDAPVALDGSPSKDSVRSPVKTPPPSRGPSVPLRVRQISAGQEHSVALTDRGTVYTWGCGRRGQLGHGDRLPQAAPTLVTTVSRRVAAVAAGAYHTVMLVAAGTIYSWGSGRQLGLGVFAGNGDQCTPQPVRALTKRRIRAISAGSNFNVALTNDGDVYTWGVGKDGQLGHGDNRDRLVPTLVETLQSGSRHGRISQIDCGSRHVAAVSSTGHVYCWGEGHYGQLGLGDYSSRSKPEWVSSLRLRRAQQVCCSARSTHVLTDYHEVVAWGCTSSVVGTGAIHKDKLGADSNNDDTFFQTHTPLEVPFHDVNGRTPKRLFGGFSHTLSVVGLTFTQLPMPQARLHTVSKPPPKLPGYGPSSSGGLRGGVTDADSPAGPESLEMAAKLQQRAKALKSRPVVELTPLEVDVAESKVDPLTPAASGPRSRLAGAKTPRLSISAQRVLGTLPPHKVKTLTAEKLRVLAREADQSSPSTGASAVDLGTFRPEASAPGGPDDHPDAGSSHEDSKASDPTSGEMPAFGADKVSRDPLSRRTGASKAKGTRGGPVRRRAPASNLAPSYALPTTSSVIKTNVSPSGVMPVGALSPTTELYRASIEERTEQLAVHRSMQDPSAGAGDAASVVSFGAGAGGGAGGGSSVAGDVGAGHVVPPGRAAKVAALKAKRIEAAKARHEEEQARRRAWRRARELRGKYKAGPQLDALFSPAHLVATSNDDVDVQDVLREYSLRRDSQQRRPYWPSPERRPPSPAAPASRGITVRDMLYADPMSDLTSHSVVGTNGSSPGLQGDATGHAPGPGRSAHSSTSVSVAAAGTPSPMQHRGSPSADSPVFLDGVSAPPPSRGPQMPQSGSGLEEADAKSLEDVLNSIKLRAAAQVEALWGSLSTDGSA